MQSPQGPTKKPRPWVTRGHTHREAAGRLTEASGPTCRSSEHLANTCATCQLLLRCRSTSLSFLLLSFMRLLSPLGSLHRGPVTEFQSERVLKGCAMRGRQQVCVTGSAHVCLAFFPAAFVTPEGSQEIEPQKQHLLPGTATGQHAGHPQDQLCCPVSRHDCPDNPPLLLSLQDSSEHSNPHFTENATQAPKGLGVPRAQGMRTGTWKNI